MIIDVALVPSQARSWRDPVTVVIDVLRASSVIVTLFQKGASQVIPISSIRQARKLAMENGYLLVGERDGIRLKGFNYDNSPTDIAKSEFCGKSVVLCTTNGTKVLAAQNNARRVLIGAYLNASACCTAAVRLAGSDDSLIGFVAAGYRGSFAIDDAVCAGYLVDKTMEFLQVQDQSACLTEAALAASRLSRGYTNILESFEDSTNAEILTRINRREDMPFCAQVDVCKFVPALDPNDLFHLHLL